MQEVAPIDVGAAAGAGDGGPRNAGRARHVASSTSRPSGCRSCSPFNRNSCSMPSIAAPPARAERAWTRDDALVELLRGRVALVGPTTAAELAAPLGINAADGTAALEALESQGVVLRGTFRAGATGLEWCERGCSRASTATRSTGCAPRSSRSARPISCASCSTGSTSRRLTPSDGHRWPAATC